MIECGREADVFEAIAFGRWWSAADDELRAHVAQCPVCRDLAAVAVALQSDCQGLVRAAQPPTAGVVWWRATIRARAEAIRTAMQPITLWQGVVAACIAGAAAALSRDLWQWGRAATALANFGGQHAALVLVALVTGLVLAPLALYFTLADD
jgi:hypothetical protein